MNRTEAQITADLDAARSAYLTAAESGTATARELLQLSDAVRARQAELGAALAAGAEPCPRCGTAPFGMVKRPGVYEVGCLSCDARARATSASAAVTRWNEGEFVPARRPSPAPAAP